MPVTEGDAHDVEHQDHDSNDQPDNDETAIPLDDSGTAHYRDDNECKNDA